MKIGDTWLAVPNAADVAQKLGLDFVPYVRTSTDLQSLDALRDSASEQSVKNGVGGVHPREGIVLRPLAEFRDSRGERVIAKHKSDLFRETAEPVRVDVDPAKRQVLADDEAVAIQWVTPTRLAHVLEAGAILDDIRCMPNVVTDMIADVLREADGLIVDTKDVRKAIGKESARIFKSHIARAMRTPHEG